MRSNGRPLLNALGLSALALIALIALRVGGRTGAHEADGAALPQPAAIPSPAAQGSSAAPVLAQGGSAAPVLAQGNPTAPVLAQGNPTAPVLADMSYRREFFDYDDGGRRDPFEPLLDVDVAGTVPRFDELMLTGVFEGEDGYGMVVVEGADRKGYFLKPGDSVGKATLVAIESDTAVFDVRDFGISRRETLKLQRPEENP